MRNVCRCDVPSYRPIVALGLHAARMHFLTVRLHGLSAGTTHCYLQNKTVLLDSPDRHTGGVPCENFSLLSVKQKKYANCVADCIGVSGKGYKHEREYVVRQQIPLSIEEQVRE